MHNVVVNVTQYLDNEVDLRSRNEQQMQSQKWKKKLTIAHHESNYFSTYFSFFSPLSLLHSPLQHSTTGLRPMQKINFSTLFSVSK